MGRSKADPCLYFAWTVMGLVIIVSWIDDNLVVGSDEVVMHTKQELMSRFECKDCGPLSEYVGCKISFLPDGLGHSKADHAFILLGL